MFNFILFSMLGLLVIFTILLTPFIQDKLRYAYSSYFDNETYDYIEYLHSVLLIATLLMLVVACLKVG